MTDGAEENEDIRVHQHLEDVDPELQQHWEEEYDAWESVEEKVASFGDRLADRVAQFGGSWWFIQLAFVFIILWMMLNKYDPYPYIMLNLVLSAVAALQAPLIMMSQRRQEDKDRARAKLDFELSRKAELEIREMRDEIRQMHKISEATISRLSKLDK